MVEGLVSDLYDGRPHLIHGAVQRAGPVLPTTCQHCRVGPPMWATDERQGHCMCGWTFFKADTVATLRGPQRPPRPPRP